MPQSESTHKLKVMIEKAIEDHELTRFEMDKILMVATEDSHIDPAEQALLDQLHELVENGSVKLVPGI